MVPCIKVAVAAFDPHIKITAGSSAANFLATLDSASLDLPNLPDSDPTAADVVAYLYWGVRKNSTRNVAVAFIVAKCVQSSASLNA